ncbi:MAG: hypothetical protein RL417_1257 [Pseudomonadota bacterium]|jgi:methionyl-tRNA formyltransferase
MGEPRHRIVFFGTPDFAAIGLRALLEIPALEVAAVVTQPDRPAGRGNKMHPSPVKVLAAERGISVLQPERIRKNEGEFLAALSALGPFEIGVVIAFGQILPEAVLHLPRHGCINVHGSILPRWRGAAPIQRAIMSGDRETGVCLMEMEAGLDTGPVFSEHRLPINPDDTFGSLHDKLAAAGAMLLKSDLLRIIGGALCSTPQATEGITYAQKVLGTDQIIDWSRSAVDIAQQIRGLDPVPGATTFLDGKRLKLFSPEVSLSPSPLTPGEIGVFNGQLSIGCGNGILSPREVQPEGKRRMSVREWLNGVQFAPGAVLSRLPG